MVNFVSVNALNSPKSTSKIEQSVPFNHPVKVKLVFMFNLRQLNTFGNET